MFITNECILDILDDMMVYISTGNIPSKLYIKSGALVFLTVNMFQIYVNGILGMGFVLCKCYPRQFSWFVWRASNISAALVPVWKYICIRVHSIPVVACFCTHQPQIPRYDTWQWTWGISIRPWSDLCRPWGCKFTWPNNFCELKGCS